MYFSLTFPYLFLFIGVFRKNRLRLRLQILRLVLIPLHSCGVVSIPGARFAGGDVKDFYLNTPLKKNRYGKVREKYIPEETIKNKLEQYIEDDGWLHFEIGKGMYGIPEAGRLANDLLKARLKNMDT